MPTRPRVLLVDDHPGYGEALHRVLSLECDVIGTIADGREVACAAAQAQPVVIVMDLNLPNISGLDARRRSPIKSVREKGRCHHRADDGYLLVSERRWR